VRSDEDPQLSVVVPVYKEELTIAPFVQRLEAALDRLRASYEVIFCLDPSPDRTEAVIAEQIQRNPRIRLMVFSRRFGQPAATMAGIMVARGEACVVIDVDLQDPPELIVPMYAKLQEGYEVVYAQRRSRKGETLIKRLLSYVAYRVISGLSEVEIPKDTGDFRIMTRRVVLELRRLNETHGFLRGMVAYVGFRQTSLEYDRDTRFEGKGKYNRLTGSLKIATNGIVAFSTRPLELMWAAGVLIVMLSLLVAAWYGVSRAIGSSDGPPVSPTIVALGFFSGIHLICFGLVGEYVGRIYEQVKGRPLFIVDRRVNFDDPR
jgi:dolichol-phosphate mannosyltransferase